MENLKFTNEIDAIRNESSKLRQMGVNIIIVLSHCGLDRDKIIAYECGDYVDVIVGGHSHSFLYTPNNEKPKDIPVAPYPLVVIPKSGRKRKVLIVHALAFSKYIGDLRVYFDDAGYVKYYDGNPIYMANDVRKNSMIDFEIASWRNKVMKLGKRIVGSTSVDLIHTQCRHGECDLGNFVADAFVNAFEGVYSAIIQAAGLRNSFFTGSIQFSDLIAVLPFENSLNVLELSGETLYEVFEHSVSRSYSENEFIGIHMLQVSGFKISFNTTQSIGKRVHSLRIKVSSDDSVYEVVRSEKLYTVVVPSFLCGGDDFTMMKGMNQLSGKELLDIDVIEAYISHNSPLTIDTTLDQRIVMMI